MTTVNVKTTKKQREVLKELQEVAKVPVRELTSELAEKIWKYFEKKRYDEQISKERVLHHLNQLKAQMGKLKNKNNRFPHMELAYNDALMKCMGAIDKKIEKIKQQ